LANYKKLNAMIQINKADKLNFDDNLVLIAESFTDLAQLDFSEKEIITSKKN